MPNIKEIRSVLKNNLAEIAIVILAFSAGVLAHAIYQERFGPTKEAAPIDLRQEEQAVLNVPGPNASEEEKQRHFELATQVSREADFLEIRNCAASPIVFRLRNSQTFSIKNRDATAHTLVIDNDHTYSIPARDTANIKADFGKGPGLYGYGCDYSPSAKGLFLVTP